MLRRGFVPAVVAAAVFLTACGTSDTDPTADTAADPVETVGDQEVDTQEQIADAEDRAQGATARADAADERASAAQERAAEAEARADEAEERATAAEQRADEAEEALAKVRQRKTELKKQVRDLTTRLEDAVKAASAPNVTTPAPAPQPAPAPAPSDPFLIPSGVITDGHHVGYLVNRGSDWFTFDMAEILSDGTWKNENPKIRELPLAWGADYLGDAPPGTPIELYVESQHVLWVVPIY